MLRISPQTRVFVACVVCAVGISLGLGLLLTNNQVDRATEDIRHTNFNELSDIAAHLDAWLGTTTMAAANLANAPAIRRALQYPTDANLAMVNETLDRYQESFGAAIAYLMDCDGLTVASSNRAAPSSFVGKNYGFRPYFKDALAGHTADYVAMGVTSGKRGYYRSCPVQGPGNTTIGVAVLKFSIKDLENELFDDSHGFLVNRDGLVLMAGEPDMLYRALDPDAARHVAAVGQGEPNGYDSLPPLFDSVVEFDCPIIWEGEQHLPLFLPIGNDGRRLFLLSDLTGIAHLRNAGRLITLLLCFLTLSTAMTLWYRQRHEARNAESQQLLEAKDREYRRLFNEMTAAFAVYDVVKDESGRTVELRIVETNPSLERMLKHPRHEILGKRFCEFVPETPQELEDQLATVVDGGDPLHREVRLESLDMIVELSAYRSENGGVAVLYLDVTEKVRARDDLLAANEALREANRVLQEQSGQLVQSEKMASIGQMAAGVAHEINNPIGFVMGNLSTLQDDADTIKSAISACRLVDPKAPTMTEDLKVAIRKLNMDDLEFMFEDLDSLLAESLEGCIRVRDIVQNLKGFARPDDKTPQAVILNECIESTLKMIWNELKYKCEVVKELGDLPDVVCFPGQINQVVMNLLVNASHAIEEKGTITIHTAAEDDHVIVRITDTGSGIQPENVAKLFDPFFTTKAPGKGTGLGLYICHNIIEQHGGTIVADSTVGVGTTFEIRLPADGVISNV